MKRRTLCLGRAFFFLGLFATTTTLLADAAEHKPVVVVSAASYGRLVANIDQFVDPRLTALVRELAGRVAKIPTDPRTMAPVGNAVKHFDATRLASTWLFAPRKRARSRSERPRTAKTQPLNH